MSDETMGSVTETAEESSAHQTQQQQQQRSALQDNIERKGKNAYYFAHAHKANGPQWDGKEEPRLLSKSIIDTDSTDSVTGSSSNTTLQRTTSSSFEYYKSNITAYSFLDDGATVKVYLTGLTDIGTQCTTSDIQLQHTERSFCITINNYTKPNENPSATTTPNEPTPLVLSFGRLYGLISNATYKIKPNKVIITLTKKESDQKEWFTINDKGSPSHEVV